MWGVSSIMIALFWIDTWAGLWLIEGTEYWIRLVVDWVNDIEKACAGLVSRSLTDCTYYPSLTLALATFMKLKA